MNGPAFWKYSSGFLKRINLYASGYMPNYWRNFIPDPGEVDCPEKDERVHFSKCVQCEKFQLWHEQDDGLRRCYHQYLDLKSRGHYDGTWDDHPENFDPETFARIQEQKRRNEEIRREMELERKELEKLSEEMEKEGNPVYEYFQKKYGEDYHGEEYDDDESDDGEYLY
jgi:hypothetical protein